MTNEKAKQLLQGDLRRLLNSIAEARKEWEDNCEKGQLKDEQELVQPLMCLYGALGSSADKYVEALDLLSEECDGKVRKMRTAG